MVTDWIITAVTSTACSGLKPTPIPIIDNRFNNRHSLCTFLPCFPKKLRSRIYIATFKNTTNPAATTINPIASPQIYLYHTFAIFAKTYTRIITQIAGKTKKGTKKPSLEARIPKKQYGAVDGT